MKTENCHGCKWLDEVKPYKGAGYCAHVVRSKYYDTMQCTIDLGHRAPRIRRPEDGRCELYCPGKFSERFKEDDHED